MRCAIKLRNQAVGRGYVESVMPKGFSWSPPELVMKIKGEDVSWQAWSYPVL